MRAEHTHAQKTSIGDWRYAGIIYARVGEADVVAGNFIVICIKHP